MPASVSTWVATYTGAWARTARAIASEGRLERWNDSPARLHDQVGVVDVVAEFDHIHPVHLGPERLHDQPEKVVGLGAGRVDAFEGGGDRLSLRGTDPDRQVSSSAALSEQDDGRVGRQFYPNPHYLHSDAVAVPAH